MGRRGHNYMIHGPTLKKYFVLISLRLSINAINETLLMHSLVTDEGFAVCAAVAGNRSKDACDGVEAGSAISGEAEMAADISRPSKSWLSNVVYT